MVLFLFLGQKSYYIKKRRLGNLPLGTIPRYILSRLYLMQRYKMLCILQDLTQKRMSFSYDLTIVRRLGLTE